MLCKILRSKGGGFIANQIATHSWDSNVPLNQYCVGMKKILLPLILSALISGCASRGDFTTFEPYKNNKGEQQFRFFAKSSVFDPENNSDSEKKRIGWLEEWLKVNNLCPNGYVIIERKPVSIGSHESVKNIYYTGKCK